MRKLTSLSQALVAIASILEENKILPLVVDRTKDLINAEKVVALLMKKEAGEFRLDSSALVVRGRRDQHPETWWQKELENIVNTVAAKNKIPITLAEADKWAQVAIGLKYNNLSKKRQLLSRVRSEQKRGGNSGDSVSQRNESRRRMPS